MKNSLKTLLALLTMTLLMTLSSATVLAVEPPSIPNPFGDPVEDDDDSFPELTLADQPVTPAPTGTQTTPTPPTGTQTTSTTTGTQPVHTSANQLTKSGPETYYLLFLLAFSLAGGYLYKLKTEKN